MYASCPKCGHAPLPKDQGLPAACPACGIILAKFAALAADDGAADADIPAARRRRARANAGEEPGVEYVDESGFFHYLKGLFTYVPEQVPPAHWQGRAVALAGALLWTFFIFRSADLPLGSFGSKFLHGVLLLFHEAGHVVFMPFGRFIATLGGSLGQLLMPLLVAGVLLVQRRDPFGAALFAWLLGFSVLDVAVYMYDAFDPQITLTDGRTGQDSDIHDWQNLFGDMGLIRKARGIGSFFGALGRLMMVGALAWAAWLLWKQGRSMSDNPTVEGS